MSGVSLWGVHTKPPPTPTPRYPVMTFSHHLVDNDWFAQPHIIFRPMTKWQKFLSLGIVVTCLGILSFAIAVLHTFN